MHGSNGLETVGLQTQILCLIYCLTALGRNLKREKIIFSNACNRAARLSAGR